MHPNRSFRDLPDALNLGHADSESFGILTVADPAGAAPLVSHVPFLLDADGRSVLLHLARPNPIVRALVAPCPARLVVPGPHGYVSPDWYGVEDQVPTWNYVAVHLTGVLELLPQEELRQMLDRQSAHFEERLLPKRPWTADKMTDGLMERMMRAIVPCRLTVAEVDGTWKLSQNKPDAVRLAAAEGVAQADPVLAALMRDPPERKAD
ncbi:FMN-binding negative transcriptional regulator [Pseudooceanicola sp. 216_PA32_1]|uniref:FMN-binding negative transcriptional regulator n=1 Tax=Pseudooceanicola pacificus TaxID=2676438 RepID=A0A844WD31_9RHOB|nr:FMN-binding negative transcriptional regulator [Pseudooceanicola pacificus]MWB79383.1 FMN-binding negative transcriptional regulator [Pseudooceanicola pacificus]